MFDFHKKTEAKRQSWCKSCQLAAKIIRRQSGNTSEKERERSRKRSQEYRKQNPEKTKETIRKWKAENAGRIVYLNTRRKRDVFTATPKWLSAEEKQKMAAFYVEAKRLEKETNQKFHVDHIVPIKGKNVSGLHVPWNLQTLLAKENMQKSNKENFND